MSPLISSTANNGMRPTIERYAQRHFGLARDFEDVVVEPVLFVHRPEPLLPI